MTAGKPEVATRPSTSRISAADAQATGLVPLGHVWDEETQAPIPRGEAIVRSQLERPLDLAHELETWQRNRETLIAFIRDHLEESDYDDRGYPVAGKIRDYYVVPGSKQKAMTKRGAGKCGLVHRYAKGDTKLVSSTETAAYCSATVEVTLLDKYQRPVGSAISSCSTAEAGFRSAFAQKKYGAEIEKVNGEWKVKTAGDFRAAMNDIVARAGKRAYVQAMIFAIGADEIFTVAEEAESQARTTEEREQESATPPAPAAPAAKGGRRFPNAKVLKQYAGKGLDEIPTDQLSAVLVTLKTKTKNPERVDEGDRVVRGRTQRADGRPSRGRR